MCHSEALFNVNVLSKVTFMLSCRNYLVIQQIWLVVMVSFKTQVLRLNINFIDEGTKENPIHVVVQSKKG